MKKNEKLKIITWYVLILVTQTTFAITVLSALFPQVLGMLKDKGIPKNSPLFIFVVALFTLFFILLYGLIILLIWKLCKWKKMNNDLILNLPYSIFKLKLMKINNQWVQSDTFEPTRLGSLIANAIKWKIMTSHQKEKLNDENCVGLIFNSHYKNYDVTESLTAYDIYKITNKTKAIISFKIKGHTLIKVLANNKNKIGTNEFMQVSENVVCQQDNYLINGFKLDDKKDYIIATTKKFLAKNSLYNHLKSEILESYQTHNFYPTLLKYVKKISNQEINIQIQN